jgi:RNA polymerase subunit RPABC4/transcription elongation factor Spt4
MKKCPVCKLNELREEGANALSRKDNETEICSQCATKEAIEEWQEFKRQSEK